MYRSEATLWLSWLLLTAFSPFSGIALLIPPTFFHAQCHSQISSKDHPATRDACLQLVQQHMQAIKSQRDDEVIAGCGLLATEVLKLGGCSSDGHPFALVAAALTVANICLCQTSSDGLLPALHKRREDVAQAESAATALEAQQIVLSDAVAQAMQAKRHTIDTCLIEQRDTARRLLIEACTKLDNQASVATLLDRMQTIIAELTAALSSLSSLLCLTSAEKDSLRRLETPFRQSSPNAFEAIIAAVKQRAECLTEGLNSVTPAAGTDAAPIQHALLLKMFLGNEDLLATVCQYMPALFHYGSKLREVLTTTVTARGFQRLEERSNTLLSTARATALVGKTREALVKTLEERHRFYKAARKALEQRRVMQCSEEDSSAGDSDSEVASPSTNQRELARLLQRLANCTKEKDLAGTALFLHAQQWEPEVLLTSRKRLSSSGFGPMWGSQSLASFSRLQEIVRKGAQQQVYHASTAEGTRCLLKRFPLQDRRSAQTEAAALTKLSHANIMKLGGVMLPCDGDSVWLHLSLAPCIPLDHFCKTQAALSHADRADAPAIMKLGHDLCEALAYLAEQGVVHCNVAPASIFVCNKGGVHRATLGGFEVSQLLQAGLELPLAQMENGHCAPGFAAPELIFAKRLGLKVTHKLDVFGLGSTIFYLHMYPRTLPAPKSWKHSVTQFKDVLFEKKSLGPWPVAAVDAWAATVPVDLVRNTTAANPAERASARELLRFDYMRRAGDEFSRVAVERPSYWQHRLNFGHCLVEESQAVCAAVERLMNDTAQPDTHGQGRDSHRSYFRRFKVSSVTRVENPRVWSAYVGQRQDKADRLQREGYAPPPMRQLQTADFTYPLQKTSTPSKFPQEVFLSMTRTNLEEISFCLDVFANETNIKV